MSEEKDIEESTKKEEKKHCCDLSVIEEIKKLASEYEKSFAEVKKLYSPDYSWEYHKKVEPIAIELQKKMKLFVEQVNNCGDYFRYRYLEYTPPELEIAKVDELIRHLKNICKVKAG